MVAFPMVVNYYDSKWKEFNDEANKYSSDISYIKVYKMLEEQFPNHDISNHPLLNGHKTPIDVSRQNEYEAKYNESREQEDYYFSIYRKFNDNTIRGATFIVILPYLIFITAFFISQYRNKKPTPYTYGFGLSTLACILIYIKELILPLKCSGFGCVGIIFIPAYILVLGMIIILLTHVYFRLYR